MVDFRLLNKDDISVIYIRSSVKGDDYENISELINPDTGIICFDAFDEQQFISLIAKISGKCFCCNSFLHDKRIVVKLRNDIIMLYENFSSFQTSIERYDTYYRL